MTPIDKKTNTILICTFCSIIRKVKVGWPSFNMSVLIAIERDKVVVLRCLKFVKLSAHGLCTTRFV